MKGKTALYIIGLVSYICLSASASTNAFSKDTTTTAVVVGLAVAFILHGWLLFRRFVTEKLTQQRLSKLEALHKLVRTASSTLDISEVLNQILLQLVKTVQCKGGVACLLGLHEQPTYTVTSQDMDITLTSRIIDTIRTDQGSDEVFVISLYDHKEEGQFPELAALSEGAAQLQVAYVNILLGGSIAGAIALYHEKKVFSQSDLDFLRSTGLATAEAIENARRFEVVRSAAELDPVTGLFNHRAVHTRLDFELKRASRASQPLAIIMIDINNFKNLNDTYGHPVGDAVLRQTANCLTNVCRETDIVARYGGDEYIAVLVNTTDDEAERLVERLTEKVKTSPYRSANKTKEIEFRLSFGVSVYPSDGEDVSTLVAVADARLYEAKRSRAQATQQPIRSGEEGLPSGASFMVLEQMVDSIGKKDGYLRQHAQTVAKLSTMVARTLGLSGETMRSLRIAALLHDIGMVGVPEYLLCKKTPLTPEDVEILRRHATIGAQIVSSVPGMEAIAECIRSHHERYDGSGYPDALRGESIPTLSRLIAVADTYAAMTSPRSHRTPKTKLEALTEIMQCSGTQFDRTMVDALVNALDEEFENTAA